MEKLLASSSMYTPFNPLSGLVHVNDIEWDQKNETTELGEAREYAVYLCEAEELFLTTPKSNPTSITIQPSTFEIFTFVPIKKIGQAVKFAPIGLTNLFNSGGTIQGLLYDDSITKIEVKGEGKFLAYSSVAPKKAYLNGAEVVFEWSGNGNLVFNIPWYEDCGGISNLTFVF